MSNKARRRGLKRTGRKFDILDQLAHHLAMAQVRAVWERKRAMPSEGGWHRYHGDDLKLIR